MRGADHLDPDDLRTVADVLETLPDGIRADDVQVESDFAALRLTVDATIKADKPADALLEVLTTDDGAARQAWEDAFDNVVHVDADTLFPKTDVTITTLDIVLER